MKLQFSLIENAKDSLEHAVDHLTQNNPTTGDYKRAILDLSHAIELLLKERVRKIHPAFIWRDVDKHKSIEAQTITSEVAVKRLRNLEGITLPEKFLKTVISCRKARNKIEHFEFEMASKEANAIIGRILSLIFHFSKIYLGQDLEKDFRKDSRWKALIEIYEFFKEHSNIIEQELKNKGEPVLLCPSCNAETFEIKNTSCKFCGHYEEIIECEACHQLFLESETETMHGSDEIAGDYSYTLCCSCIKDQTEESMALDMIADWYRDN